MAFQCKICEQSARDNPGFIPCSGNSSIEVKFGDNLAVLSGMPKESIDLIYIDPPFNTQKKRSKTQLETNRCQEGDRVGFQGKTYRTIEQ